jgi:hypothetical protein
MQQSKILIVGALTVKAHLSEQGLLDRFSADAIKWAEQGVEWIEIEGEPFTLVSQLEKLKGVEPGDFTKNAGLLEASSFLQVMLPDAHQRLLAIPGVRRSSAPEAFAVDGALVLHCGGPDAKAGITRIVRSQRPDWVRAQYLLANMRATLAYLSHGTSKVAKATRDLTIGTTMNVAQAAVSKENAPMAVIPFVEGGDPAVTALLMQAIQLMNANAERAVLKADHAQLTAEAADQKAERALQQLSQRQLLLNPSHKKKIPSTTREKVYKIWKKHFHQECPCCHKHVSGEQGTMQIDHFYNHTNDLNNLWLICVACNQRMGKPGPQRTERDRRRFATWQDRAGMQVTQISFIE